VFFVEAHYHNSPKRAGDQVRYIAHREEQLPDGRQRELFGIGQRYRALRGNETAIRRVLIEDGRGLRKPAYFRFIFTVDEHAAARFARLDPRWTERTLRDAIERTTRGTARGLQGVFAVHQHGGDQRLAHPHIHALFSPRFEGGRSVHLSATRISAIRERWESEVLRSLERQERRIEKARNDHTPMEALTPYRAPDRGLTPIERPGVPLPERPRGAIGILYLRARKARRQAGVTFRWVDFLRRPGFRLDTLSRDPERTARRAAFRLASALAPNPIRDALWALRGLRGLGMRQR